MQLSLPWLSMEPLCLQDNSKNNPNNDDNNDNTLMVSAHDELGTCRIDART